MIPGLEDILNSGLRHFNTILIFSRLAICEKHIGNEYQFCISYEGLFPL